jgi:RNA-directed DNA polymerase
MPVERRARRKVEAVLDGKREDNTGGSALQKAQQAGEVRARWAWTEPAVWTDRMLTALENGVQGGKWFRLIDKVYALPTLRAAFEKVKTNQGAAGIDHQSIGMFGQQLEANLEQLAAALKGGSYQPQAVRRVWIPKAGKKELRPLGIPTVRDRVVQAALRSVLEPIFEREFAGQSYGFRPKRSCKDALRRVDGLLKAGYTWVVDADIKGYFDSIPHQSMMDRVETRIADGKVLRLVKAFLKAGIQETDEKIIHPEAGTPQGGVISPLLSNIYLNPLDHHMAAEGFQMVRYADDFVILCRSEEEARAALEKVRVWTGENGLSLHPEKTRIVQVKPDREKNQSGEGFDFLGYRFWRKWKMPCRRSSGKFKEAIRAKTPRKHGSSLETIITNVNETLRGWYGYFKHSVKNSLEQQDKWVRMRLRSILRKRRKHRGCGRGYDHIRWPNAYFTERGLFSLLKAHARDSQSLPR